MNSPKKISLIVAHGKTSRDIGRGLDLLWKISDDMKRFKALTSSHPIIMGRKTYDSIGRSLPNRTNIVISRNRSLVIDGCVTVDSLENALRVAEESPGSEEVFVIGGGEIYNLALPHAQKLYLTLVESDETGDIFFPEWENVFTKKVFEEDRVDAKTGLRYTWLDVER